MFKPCPLRLKPYSSCSDHDSAEAMHRRERKENQGLLRFFVVTLGVAWLVIAGGRLLQAQQLPTATSPGASIAIGGTYSEFKAKYPNTTLSGGGAYVDINFRRQLGIELEARFLRQGEVSGSYQTTYLIGPKVQFPHGRFSPYAKGLVGNGHLVFPYGFGYGNYLVIAPGGGLDVRITEKIKVRVVDFEYQVWPDFSLGEITPYGVSAGVSYDILNPSGWRRHRYR